MDVLLCGIESCSLLRCAGVMQTAVIKKLSQAQLMAQDKSAVKVFAGRVAELYRKISVKMNSKAVFSLQCWIRCERTLSDTFTFYISVSTV